MAFFCLYISCLWIFQKKIRENTKCNPQNYYGYTKYLAEKYLLKKKINVCIGRIFSYSSNSQKQSFFIPSIINKLRSPKNNIIKVENVNHYKIFDHKRNS